MKRDEVRRIDQIAIEKYGMLGLVLMENAGRGAAERIASFCRQRCEAGGRTSETGSVCIVCGTGNNGGDGYVIARHLQLLGVSARIVSLVPLDKLSGDAKANAMIAEKARVPIAVARSRDDLERLIVDGEAIVDCMLGTGATGNPRGLYADAVQIANLRSGPRIAIDLPTGLDCDTGEPGEPTFRASLTVTFVAEKDGFSGDRAAEFIGRVEVVGIGVPKALLDEFAVTTNA